NKTSWDASAINKSNLNTLFPICTGTSFGWCDTLNFFPSAHTNRCSRVSFSSCRPARLLISLGMKLLTAPESKSAVTGSSFSPPWMAHTALRLLFEATPFLTSLHFARLY
ncbi:hypothetical protein CSUI_011448, partial [Cystoisospora suis]